MAFRFRTIGVWRPAVMIFVCFLWLGALMSRAAAVTNYVAQAGQTPLTNYLTWATAASNIQDAINVAVASNTVLVSNGTYNLTNQISITTAITLKSVNGTNFTFINGNNFAGKSVTNRCVSMTAAGSVLDGFTITNGVLVAPATATGGGGVYINPGAVYNCYILWNTVYATNTYSGGGGSMLTLAGLLPIAR